MSERLLRLFLQCRALWFFHAMKEHDRTTTKRIQDNRLRVSLLKNTKILIPVHILSQEVFPQLLQVSPFLYTRLSSIAAIAALLGLLGIYKKESLSN